MQRNFKIVGRRGYSEYEIISGVNDHVGILRQVNEKGRRLVFRYKSAIPFFVIVLFFEVIPIVNMISRSFLDPEMRFTLNNYVLIFTKSVYLVAIRNSLFLSFVSSFFGVINSLSTAR